MRFHSARPHSEHELLVAGKLRQMAHRQTPYVGRVRFEKRLRRQRRPKVKFFRLLDINSPEYRALYRSMRAKETS